MFTSYQEKLSFKILDLECDPCSQGFCAGTYDVVVASFVLHATASLKRTLTYVRAILRPGGFLIVAEGSMNSPLLSFIFGSLPGWWVGRGDEGRKLSPAVSVEQWHRLLVATGFSGIDTRCPVSWEETLGVFLFASQAVDDGIRFLRDPLSETMLQHQRAQSLILIGGQTAHTEPLIQEVESHLRHCGIHISIFESLVDVDYTHPAPHERLATPVLSMTDLDKPIFEDMTKTSFAAFHQLLQTGRTMLWVTSGRLSGSPFSNMVVGFGRSATQEIPGLNLQHLDLEDPFGQDAPRTIAATFLRLLARTTSTEENPDDRVLWTVEPEIFISKDGRQRAPRLQPLNDLNVRYNSGRRYITQKVPIDKVPVFLRFDHNSALTLEQRRPTGCIPENSMDYLSELRITHAFIPALKSRLGHKFLVLGVNTRTKAHQLALVSSVSSIMRIPTSQAVPIPRLPISESVFLSILAAHLIAMEVIDPLVAGQTVLVHDVPRIIAEAIRVHAALKGVTSIFVVDSGVDTDIMARPDQKVTQLAPYLSQVEIWQELPAANDIACFVSLASGDNQRKSRDIILAGLPPWCRRELVETLYAWVGHDSNPVVDTNTVALIQRALTCVKESRNVPNEYFSIIPLQDLVPEDKKATPRGFDQDVPFILDQTTSTCLPARVLRPDANRPLFRADRTYWVVGLSGTLGVSLCDWLARAGVRHLVISSRNPVIESTWIESHHRNGVDITIMPW